MNDLIRIAPPRFPDVVLRTPPNGSIVAFLAILGGAHLAIAVSTLLHGRWEGYLSFVFAAVFLGSAVFATRFHREISIQVSRRQIRLRTGVGRWRAERSIPFDAVSAVKLTLRGTDALRRRIEIVCLLEEIECPPTRVARQEALLLAMMLEVTLIKVIDGEIRSSETPGSSSSRRVSP